MQFVGYVLTEVHLIKQFMLSTEKRTFYLQVLPRNGIIRSLSLYLCSLARILARAVGHVFSDTVKTCQ